MLIVGLTGGISTGKSTVSKRLREKHHAAIVDADRIAHDVLRPGQPAYKEVVEYFSELTPNLILDDGSREINRPALGRTVFTNEKHRRVLNRIVHPAVRREMLKQVFLHWIKLAPVVYLDVPLLFESHLDEYCGKTVVVVCTAEQQLNRLCARNPELSVNDARSRISAQMPLAEKGERSDIVLRNDGSVEDLNAAVDKLAEDLKPNWMRTLLQLIPPVGILWGLLVFYLRRRRSRNQHYAGK